MEALRILGIDVIGEKIGRNYYYHVGSKQFDIVDLKLLVDAIQSSKFITEKKSNELIKKIAELANEYEASQLKRQLTVQGRVKTMNESINYIIDNLLLPRGQDEGVHVLDEKRTGEYQFKDFNLPEYAKVHF